jgi:hypothetical protein
MLPLTSIISLFLCGAIAALWVRSYRQVDYVLWKTSADQDSIGSAYGRVVFKCVRGFPVGKPGIKTTPAVASSWSTYFEQPLTENVLGFAWVKSASIGQYKGHNVYFRLATVPDWFLLSIFLAIPLGSAIKRSRRRRAMAEGA